MTDQQITDLPVDNTPTRDDIAISINNPTGTPGSRQSSWGDIFDTFLNDIFVSLIPNADATYNIGSSVAKWLQIFVDRLTIGEDGSTATPAADDIAMYGKVDGLLYSKDSAGVEKLVSGGGSVVDLSGDSSDSISFGEPALTDQATIAWDMKANPAAKVTLGGNRTMGAPTNHKAGTTYILRIIQDGTGSRTITWNAVFKWFGGGVAPELSTAAASVDLISFYSDGVNLWGAPLLDGS